MTDGAILLDRDGREVWVVVVKATFDLSGGLSDEQQPIITRDVYRGEPGASSLLHESDVSPPKPGTDVIVNGHAHAPKGKLATVLDVAVRVAGRKKALRVYGDRVWRRSIWGMFPSEPSPFDRMPLVYERAFGGTVEDEARPGKVVYEARNPVGVGFYGPRGAPEGAPVPNIEDPEHEIRSIRDRPPPAGTGHIGKHWLPRRAFAGTYDQAWADERRPILPADFDDRFWLGAHPDLAFVPHLQGGEAVELLGLSPTGPLPFELPRIALGFRTWVDDRPFHHTARLATVVIEPDLGRFTMLWQTACVCRRNRFSVRETEVVEKRVITWR